jgi:hypothetical protein
MMPRGLVGAAKQNTGAYEHTGAHAAGLTLAAPRLNVS